MAYTGFVKIILLLIVLGVLSGCSQAGKENSDSLNITNLFSSTQAATGKLSAETFLEGIPQGRLQRPPLAGGIGEAGITYWYYGIIPSKLISGSTRVIEVTYPIYDLVDLWIRQNGKGIKHYKAGTLRPFASRPLPDPDFAFPLPSDAGDAEIVIAIETTSPIPFSVRLWSSNSWQEHQSGASLWYGIFFGAIGILLIYNLFLAFALKDPSYFYYVAYLGALAMLSAMNSGYSEEYLWPGYGGITTRFVLFVASLAVVFVLQFCNHFLGVRTFFPRVWRMSLVIMAVVLLFSLSEVLGFTSGMIVVVIISLSDVTLLYYTLISIASYRAGIKQARYILVAFSMYIVGYVYYQMYLLAVIEPSWLAVHSIEIGILLEAIMLSLALADRINVISQKKEIAEESMLVAQREFSRRIIKAQEEDRESFANTLHDSIGHGLLVLKQGLEEVLEKPVSNSIAAEKVRSLANYCGDVLRDVRGLSHDLHPHILTRLGLKAAIETMLERALPPQGIEWTADIHNTDEVLDSDSQLAILRCIQEAINNILKHANASEVIVSLHVQEQAVSIDIKDDGIGFDVGKNISGGMGLGTMKGRTELLGGHLEFDSKPGTGTHIEIRVPIK
ncbi:MAG: 7TM diverse intracellular signaling domain-containing protein [Acidiferrobacterales bacterium]